MLLDVVEDALVGVETRAEPRAEEAVEPDPLVVSFEFDVLPPVADVVFVEELGARLPLVWPALSKK